MDGNIILVLETGNSYYEYLSEANAQIEVNSYTYRQNLTLTVPTVSLRTFKAAIVCTLISKAYLCDQLPSSDPITSGS